MLALVILAVVMAGFAGLIAVAQPHAGDTPAAALSDAIARNCLAVFAAPSGTGNVVLPDGVWIQASGTECAVQAPYGVLTVGALSASDKLIGGVWMIESRSGQFVIHAVIAM